MFQFQQGEDALAGCVPSNFRSGGPSFDAPLRCYGAARTSLAEVAASTEGVAGRDAEGWSVTSQEPVTSRSAGGLGHGTTQGSGTGIITRPSRDVPESGASINNPTWSLVGTTAEERVSEHEWTNLWWNFYPPDAQQPAPLRCYGAACTGLVEDAASTEGAAV